MRPAVKRLGGLALLAWLAAVPVAGAVWKASSEIGLVSVYAELNDAEDPVTVLVRVENHSRLARLEISPYFVQMTDAANRVARPVSADEVVSGRLRRLRLLLPQHERELDLLLGDIQADYPQQKLVAVYGKLKAYLESGRPLGWRSQVENWVLGVPPASPGQIQDARKLVEDIGTISRNYLWPRDVAPDSVYTGAVFFERPTQDPPSIFFQINKQFLGLRMTQTSSRKTAGP